ncbi:hypothetical protein C8F01DRAFT_994952, partial [Mycena amicta]
MSQYRAQTDTLADDVVKCLTKMVSDFMNEGKGPLIARAVLEAPIAGGGKKLINLRARNEAINVMKLKTYLNLDMHTRAKWAFFADQIFANHRVKNSPMRPDAVYIPFLQHWLPTTRHQRDRTPLNASLKMMVKAAAKYGVELEPPSYAGLVEMPIWHHYGQDINKRQVNNAPTHRCLREVHKVLQV